MSTVRLSRAATPAFYNHDAVLIKLAAHWEGREGAPDTGTAAPILLSDICNQANCPMPPVIKPATDALGEALGDEHVLYVQPVNNQTRLGHGGSGRLDPIDAWLTVYDINHVPPVLAKLMGRS